MSRKQLEQIMFVIVSPLPNLTEKNMVCFLCPVIRLFWAAMADQIPPKADPRPIQSRLKTDIESISRFKKQTLKALLKMTKCINMCAWYKQRAGLHSIN